MSLPVWTNIPTANNWQNFRTSQGGDWELFQCAYYAWSGTVEIRGLIRRTAGFPTQGEIIGTLPTITLPGTSTIVPIRPSGSFIQACASGLDTFGLVQFLTDGTIRYFVGNPEQMGIRATFNLRV